MVDLFPWSALGLLNLEPLLRRLLTQRLGSRLMAFELKEVVSTGTQWGTTTSLRANLVVKPQRTDLERIQEAAALAGLPILAGVSSGGPPRPP